MLSSVQVREAIMPAEVELYSNVSVEELLMILSLISRSSSQRLLEI